MRKFFGILATIALSGCIFQRSGAVGRGLELKEGVTTRREVVSAWGNPDYARGDEWIWKGSRLIGSKVKAAYMAVGVTVANSQKAIRQWRLTFDKAGVLRHVEVTDSIPGGATWNPNPF